MNKSGVLTCKSEVKELVGQQYKRPDGPGTYQLRLDSRNWYNRRGVYGLVCNFSDENGNKIALFAFRHKRPKGEIYCPKKTDIDFAHEVEDGTWWNCEIKETKSGNLTWISAEQV